MESASPTIFDPYHKWLGIRDFRSAPNHYRLLGIDLFENDEDVIRDAAARQMTHLKTYRVGAQREMCSRIIDEVAQARVVLLDRYKKEDYDRELKLKSATSAPVIAVTTNGLSLIADLDTVGGDVPPGIIGSLNGIAPARATGGAGRPRRMVGGEHAVECHACGIENAASRQFCSGCGARLWEPCLKCTKLNGGQEKHCGACGANLLVLLQQVKDALKVRFDKAASLAENHQHVEAIDLLLGLKLPDHSALAKYAERQRDTLARLHADMARASQEREEALGRGRELLTGYDFEQAALVLEGVPEAYRNEAHAVLLDEVRGKQVEILTIEAEIRRALAEKRTDGLLDKVENLLSIKPDHFQVRQLREQLRPLEQRKLLAERDALYKSASAHLAQHNYSAALAVLELIPDESRTPQIVKMIDDVRAKANESEWLVEDLRQAVEYDDQLLPIAERLLKMRPNDEAVARIAARLRYQAANGKTGVNGHSPFPKPLGRSVWGPPLETAAEFARIDTQGLKDDAFTKGPDRFCVAAGLALQGLARCVVQVNLAPPERDGLLSGLFKPRKRPTTTAWGIDLGRAAVKAIQLRFDSESEKVIAEKAIYLQHAKPQNQGEVNPNELLTATLDKLFEQITFAGSLVCVSLPANKVMFRPIAVPFVDEKKVPELMRFEAKQQIPFPLNEVVWGYQMLSSVATEMTVVRECEVLLAALRLEDAHAALAPFVEKKVKVDVLQSDATALLNFYLHEIGLHGVGGPAGGQTPADAATGGDNVSVILDVGTDCSNLIVTDIRSVVVRSIPVGGNAFSRALIKEFQITIGQAEKLKRNPTAVRELHRLYDVLEPRLGDLVRETQRTVDAFLQQDRSRQVKRFIVLGGGIKMHGALRRLWHGEPDIT